MNFVRLICLLLLCLAPLGCNTIDGRRMTPGEIEMRRLNVEGLRIGATKKEFLKKFPTAMLQPFGRTDREVYEVNSPLPQISLMVAYFVNDVLMKLELRYFNGAGVHTLNAAGGGVGIQNYMIAKFGQPTATGDKVYRETEAGDIDPKFAKFNGEWNFPALHRKAQYLLFEDTKGAMGIVTFLDTTPSVALREIALGVVRQESVSGPTTTVTETVIVPIGPPNPGF